MEAKPPSKKLSRDRIDFFDKVYKIIAQIPYGKVTTYGAIAEACGIKSSARTVGWALNSAKESNLPCHRVVNRMGALSGKMHFGSTNLMYELLIAEGIEFDEKERVILEKYFWNPVKKKKGWDKPFFFTIFTILSV